MAIPEIERWLLLMVSRTVRAALHQRLNFDPIDEPHRLSSTAGGTRDTQVIFDETFDDEE